MSNFREPYQDWEAISRFRQMDPEQQLKQLEELLGNLDWAMAKVGKAFWEKWLIGKLLALVPEDKALDLWEQHAPETESLDGWRFKPFPGQYLYAGDGRYERVPLSSPIQPGPAAAEGRVIAIGDIHGCSLALASIIRAIDPTPLDTIIALGDYIDRGPDSRGVLEMLLSLRDQCALVPLMGNHEEMLLAARESRRGLQFWLKFGGEAMLRSYSEQGGWEVIPPDHVDFIKSCRRYFETTSHIFVHAGYDPKLPMHEQPATSLFWENPSFARLAPHCSRKTVIVGHTPQRSGEILNLGHIICIDTACGLGGCLTAFDVATGHIWQADERGTLNR